VILLLKVLLRLVMFDLDNVDASTGNLLGVLVLLPTLERDLVTGWLLANVVSILFNVEVLDPLSETGSSEASGDVLGDVDIGDPADLSVEPCTGSSRSRNGFLLLFGDVKGLDLPMVANLCSLARSSSLAGWVMNGLVKGLIAAWVSVNKVSFCTPVRPF